MPDPIPPIWHPVQRCILYVNSRIAWIKIYIPDRGRLPCLRVPKTHTLEERGRDKIDILAWVGKHSHHAEGCKGCHGTRVVVSGETGSGIVEL